MFDTELDGFKVNINLHAYAAAHGYVDDQKASWDGALVMRHPPSDDKIVVRQETDGRWLWLSNHTGRKGSIIDFVHYLKGGSEKGRINIGAIRKELRSWSGQPSTSVSVTPTLRRPAKDRMKVEAAYAKMQDAVDGHPYLVRDRALPMSLLTQERFASRIRIDARGNAIFPHFDAEGLSGYEMKNVAFTGFASGGAKTLWLSQEFPDDNRLVFCESAIDALSYAALFPSPHSRYASIGGGLNDKQPEIIRAAIARTPQDAEIVAAMDADEAGRRYANAVQQAVKLAGDVGRRFLAQEPMGFKDWNDQLRGPPGLFHAVRNFVPMP
jgi:hypothetical protein